MSAVTYPSLTLFLQGYLHQDWVLDYANPWHALAAYMAGEPSADRLAAEISELLASADDDQTLDATLMHELRCGYVPSADGYTARTWLLEVRERASGTPGPAY